MCARVWLVEVALPSAWVLVQQSLFRYRGTHLLDGPVMGSAENTFSPRASKQLHVHRICSSDMAGDGLGTGPEGAAPDELVLRDICENNAEGRVSAEVGLATSKSVHISNIDPSWHVSQNSAPVWSALAQHEVVT